MAEEGRKQLGDILKEYHEVFSLEEGEQGETDVVEMTGNTMPKRQQVRRVLFALRKEIAWNLKEMQKNGVIQPSIVHGRVLSRKRMGAYRKLKTAMKSDKFLLPQIDDLLDQLGKSQHLTYPLGNTGGQRIEREDSLHGA